MTCIMTTQGTLIAASLAGALIASPAAVGANKAAQSDKAKSGRVTPPPVTAPLYPEARPLSPVTLRGAGQIGLYPEPHPLSQVTLRGSGQIVGK